MRPRQVRSRFTMFLFLVLAVIAVYRIGFYTPHYEVIGELPQELAFELGR